MTAKPAHSTIVCGEAKSCGLVLPAKPDKPFEILLSDCALGAWTQSAKEDDKGQILHQL